MCDEKLENHIEFLLSAALQKCGDIHTAEDLTQETFLAALSCMARGKEIRDLRAWLLVTMGRKFNDMLRKKYRQPIVSIGEDFDLVDENAAIWPEGGDEEAENVRKAVSYLAKIHREVIVRYYMKGQSISRIASELGIPEGTVKSRLHLGRNQVKKGIRDMEKYAEQSYSPVTLHLSYSGRSGLNGEPTALVEGDLIAQNVLWLAYAKPAAMEEIAPAVGIPAAYVEPAVRKLTEGGLMKKIGNKYYTDFMISTVEDMEKHIPAQKKCVQDHFDLFWGAVEKGLEKLRRCELYRRCAFDAGNSLELYTVFHCLDHGIYRTFSEIFQAEQEFPERPDGGRWIAFGHVNFREFNPREHQELLAHTYSGERSVRFDKYADSGLLEMHVYGADGFPGDSYYHSPDYTFFPENVCVDAEIAKLLYTVYKEIEPERVGLNPEYLKAVPWLTRCGIFREEAGRPIVNIPVLTKEEAQILWDICAEAEREMTGDLRELLTEFFRGKKQALPAHLNSVPLQKQYLHAEGAMVFATIREAIARGRLYDGHYDDVSEGVNQYPCPMVLVVGA